MTENRARAPRKFTPSSDQDLRFYYDECAGTIGLASSFDALVGLALAGIPDGGTIAQPTKARMSRWTNWETPAERQARVAEVLAHMDLASVRILAAAYLPGRHQNTSARRRTYKQPPMAAFGSGAGVHVERGKLEVDGVEQGPGQEHVDPVLDLLTPLEAEYKDLAQVVRLVAEEAATLALAKARTAPDADPADKRAWAAAQKVAKAARQEARAEIKSIRAKAERALSSAQGAYQEVADQRPSRKRRETKGRAALLEIIGRSNA